MRICRGACLQGHNEDVCPEVAAVCQKPESVRKLDRLVRREMRPRKASEQRLVAYSNSSEINGDL